MQAPQQCDGSSGRKPFDLEATIQFNNRLSSSHRKKLIFECESDVFISNESAWLLCNAFRNNYFTTLRELYLVGMHLCMSVRFLKTN